MQFSTQLISLNYERNFKSPAFGLLESRVSILREFYEKINPRFPLNLSDMVALPGNTLDNIGIKITLFNGNGVLELSAEKMDLCFTNLISEEDILVAKDVISLYEESFFGVFSNAQIKDTAIKTSSWLQLQDDEKAGNSILNNFSSSYNINPEDFGADAFGDPVLKTSLMNLEEGWAVSFHLEKSKIPKAQLFFMCDCVYLEYGRYNSLDDRKDHIRKMYLKFLAHLGLELADK